MLKSQKIHQVSWLLSRGCSSRVSLRALDGHRLVEKPQQGPKHCTLLAHPKVHTSLLHGFSPTQVSAQPARGFICGLGCSAVKWLELLASGGHNYPSKLTPIEMNGSTPFSAGVIVAVCLAVDSKGRVYLGVQPEMLESASPSLLLSFF